MITLQNFQRVVTSTCAAILLGTVAVPVLAQTQEQMRVFQSLTPEQQQEILQKLGEQKIEPRTSTTASQTSMPKVDDATRQFLEALEAEPRLRAGDSLLLSIAPIADQKDLGRIEFRQRVLDGNPYLLDRTGRLMLPESINVILAGLTADESMRRLNAEPSLKGFQFELSILPVEPELRPFGYELFRTVPTTFAPATDIPVPADYVVGPGDSLELQLIGERGGRYTLTVGRDGVVDFPELGPIAVAGMRFAAAKTMLEQRVSEQMIGMRGSVSMGALRSIQVFVLGDAERPGSYTVSGLSTITNALFASGGVKPIGSLRNIELKRNGRTVSHFDLYDLLLNGDTSQDARLLPGDVIFIPPVGITVAATGEVQRPAIYELRDVATASEILRLSGGLTPRADPRTAVLERIDERLNRTVMDLDLSTAQGHSTPLQTGDLVRIQPIRESFEGAVALLGHVHRPGSVQYRPSMRLTDLVGSLDELKPLADPHYALIRRETGPTRTVSVMSVDIAAAFANPDTDVNAPLQPRDRVHVFDLASSRDRVVAPILEELGRQSSHDEPLQVVGVGGRAKVPGQYPLEQGMRVSDLVRAGGGLDDAAYVGEAELTRYVVENGERRQTELMRIDMQRLRAGDLASDVSLRPYDYLVIKEVPEWGKQETITISGEVRFPGTYPIQRGETLQSILRRAGGLTDAAFAEGSVFTRRELQQREQRQLDLLADRLQRDLTTLALQGSQTTPGAAEQATQAVAIGKSLLEDLRRSEAVGRLVIDLPRLLAADAHGADGLILRDGDRLVVPRRKQEVTVLGEVPNTTSHLWRSGLTSNDYIERSGGTTQRADRKRIYVVRANGGVDIGGSGRWFSRGGNIDIHPGDTIVVPLDAERMRPLPLWTAVTTIIYNLAVAVAAVNSF